MLGRLFGGENKNKKPKSTNSSLAPAVRSAIVSAIGSKGIPSMPGAAQKAFQLSIDPNAEARDFVEVIESDEALSARVIKIANSVYFDRGKKSETIEDSVNVIGINELRCLLNATSLSDLFPSKHPARSQLWSHNIAVAIIARNLSRTHLPSKEEAAFLGGLMHDIGKLLLLQRCHEDYDTILESVRDGKDFCSAEEDIYVFNHTDVGQLIAERWHFTGELTDIIRSHHLRWDTLKEAASPSLVSIVKAANTLAHSLGLGQDKTFNRLRNQATEELHEVWSLLNIPNDEQKSLLASCERAYTTEHDLYAKSAI
jgi:putative nucleotidyltransferase with HDIG domain